MRKDTEMGAPMESQEDEGSERITVYLTPLLLRALVSEAKRHERSMSWIIRDLLRQVLIYHDRVSGYDVRET